MKSSLRSMRMLFRQLRGDSILLLMCFLPVLIAGIFRYGIPFAEAQLQTLLSAGSILIDYYLLFDLFLAVFAPYFLVFVSAMVMLSEIDENIAGYLAVTPIRKQGYILSRLVCPALLSVPLSAVLLALCSLTDWTAMNLLLASLLSVLVCIPVAMLVVVYSHNRVEGMALAKLSGLLLFGLPVPFFLKNVLQYLFAWMPSFWVAKLFVSGNYWALLPAVLVSAVWIGVQYKKFERKLL